MYWYVLVCAGMCWYELPFHLLHPPHAGDRWSRSKRNAHYRDMAAAFRSKPSVSDVHSSEVLGRKSSKLACECLVTGTSPCLPRPVTVRAVRDLGKPAASLPAKRLES